ncbi:hypothetical protein [Dyadobacter arcticus]|uniref:DUF642 domain-containing protein n=1 Tax=Dyadobacter arcticus TaxID=1078754 RepID=A0ABX0UKT5_9BACT|nr:hypothetical protein [Dyadobacter arcticus]NIJ53627.1 hypothetical protein [Dyadobacter arcticus]
MKTLFSLTLIALLFCASFAQAQLTSNSTGNPCNDCAPNGWTKTGGGSAISTTTHYGGLVFPQFAWNQPAPPSSIQPAPIGGNGGFLTIYNSASESSTASTTITGLTIGKKYKFKYYLISLSVANGGYGTSGTITLSNGAASSLTTDFLPGGGTGLINVDMWTPVQFSFTPTASTVTLTFSGTGGSNGGSVGLAMNYNSIFRCDTGSEQVNLVDISGLVHNVCPLKTVNLNDLVTSRIPANCELVWFVNPYHEISGGNPSEELTPETAQAAGTGAYYAFWFDTFNSCYNTDVSAAQLSIDINNCPDISPSLDISGLNFGVIAKDFVVKLKETKGVTTAGNFKFRLNKPGGFTITYPTVSGNSNVFGGTPNQNGNWSFSEAANYIEVTSTTPIPANGTAIVGFTIKRKPGISSGTTQNVKATIVGGAGGDDYSSNNSIVTNIATN